MSTPGSIIAPDTVRFERTLPGPIERVWAFLTEPDQRALWLAGGPMEQRVGGRVELHFRHSDLSPAREPVPEKYRQYEDGGTVHGTVTRWEPPMALAYTWEEVDGHHSEVTFELAETGDDVELILTHRRLREGPEMLSVASGWHTHLAILGDRLDDRIPTPFWSAHERHEREYANLLGGS